MGTEKQLLEGQLQAAGTWAGGERELLPPYHPLQCRRLPCSSPWSPLPLTASVMACIIWGAENMGCLNPKSQWK